MIGTANTRDKGVNEMSSALKRGERIGRELGEKIGEKIGEERARQVFKLYMQGKPPEEIADICGISKEKVLELLE